MRVLLTVFASRAHIFNVVSLGWALRAAGHEVRVAGHPDTMEIVSATGLTAVAVGDVLDMGGAWQSRGTGNLEVLSRGLTVEHDEQLARGWDHVLGELTMACGVRYEFLADQSFVDGLVKLARAWQPDLVIWDALTFAGAVAAKACGAAHARLLFGLDLTYRLFTDFLRLRDEQPPELRDSPLDDWFTGRLSRVGVEYTPDMALEMMTGQWTIDPMQQWMSLPTTLPTVPMRAIPYNGPTTIPSWVYEEPARPRVCLTLGVSLRELVGGAMVSTSELLTTLASLDIELIATLDASQLDTSSIPSNVTVVDFVPLNELLPSCSAMIHQNGFGTLTNAVTHGVPSVIIPDPFWDEAEGARMLEGRGAALTLMPADFTAEALRSCLDRVLTEESFRRSAAHTRRDLLSAPTPQEIVPTLEALTAAHR
jgi:glycosyltransferase (activator-dependent family)